MSEFDENHLDPAETIDVRRGMFGVQGSGDTSGYGRLIRPITLPGSTPRPYGGYFDEIVDNLQAALDEGGVGFEQAIEKVVVFREELTIDVRREYLLQVASRLRDEPDLRFELCLGVSGVHYPGDTGRAERGGSGAGRAERGGSGAGRAERGGADTGRELHAVYPFMSITHNRRIRLEVSVSDADPHIPSLCGVYPTNDWHEREVFDFFGIVFDGHPSLTRIQMPDDWQGHPQRKDYPLGGIPVEYKGAQIPPPDERRGYH